MRYDRRSLLVGFVGILGLAGALAPNAGCSGATSQEALESQPSGGTSGGTSGATSGGTSGTTSGGLDASVDGSATCPQEVEPNNSADSANLLGPTRCGAISPNGESDFLTFVLQDKTTSMQIMFTGKVQLKVTVANQTVILVNGNAPKVPFVKGAHYLIEITSVSGGKSVPWRVDLLET